MPTVGRHRVSASGRQTRAPLAPLVFASVVLTHSRRRATRGASPRVFSVFVSVDSVSPFVNLQNSAASMGLHWTPRQRNDIVWPSCWSSALSEPSCPCRSNGEEPASNDAERRTQRCGLGGDALGTAWNRDIRSVRRPQRRVAHLRRRSRQHPLRPARSDQPRQLQRPRDRLAVQDGQPRPEARVQLPVHAAHGQRQAVLDGRFAPRGRGARRRHRRAAVDAQRERGSSRGSRPEAAVRPGTGVLD